MANIINKTKIVATLGPSSSSKAELKRMFEAGVSVCRLNFSHGTHADHLKSVELVSELNHELGTNVALLADLQGPKLRIGDVQEGTVIAEGEDFVITTKKCIGNANQAYMTYPQFPSDVSVGDQVLIDDGKILLEVTDTNKTDTVKTVVLFGGPLKSNKGVNLPNTNISLPCLTEKDLIDLEFVLKETRINWIGLSFVRSAKDIQELRFRINAVNSHALIIAKIEKPEALVEIDGIILASDAIMVARGDLGVEIPFEDVPLVQKMIVNKCTKTARPVIIATQMMESMIDSFRPTRAEVSDVANSILDGADAVMLSGETSVGIHPHKVIETMAAIARKVEETDDVYYREYEPDPCDERFDSNTICYTACKMVQRVGAKAIIAMSNSGYTAKQIASQRPKAHIYAFTENKNYLNTLNLVWGVRAFYYDKYISTDDTITDVKEFLKNKELIDKGDKVVNLASIPLAARGRSNMLKLSEVE